MGGEEVERGQPRPYTSSCISLARSFTSHAPVSSYIEISAFRDYLRGLNNNLVLSWYILCMARFLTSSLQVRAQKPQPLSILLKSLVRLAASLTDACSLLFTGHSQGPGEFLTGRGSSVRLGKGCWVSSLAKGVAAQAVSHVFKCTTNSVRKSA